MFIVYNKEKIISAVITCTMVFPLFFMAATFNKYNENTVQTSANASNKIPIYSVATQEKKVALTINCAWTADDIDKILSTLEKHNIKITFFVVGDWVRKISK